MATVIVLLPAITYESFEYSDLNPLEKVRVLPASTDEERLASLRIVARQVIDSDYLTDEYDLPREPTLKVSEVDPERIAELQRKYQEQLALVDGNIKRNELVEAFFEGNDDSVADEELLLAWLEKYTVAAAMDDERRCFYFREIEGVL